MLTGNHGIAHDPVQAALVRTYVAWSRVRPETALAYTRRTSSTSAPTGGGDTGPSSWVAAPPEASTTADSATEDRDVVVRLLTTLPEQQRKVVVLRYYTDLSEQATADALNASVGSVRSAASRGLATLRAELARTEGGVR